MTQNHDFGKAVKIACIERNMSQRDLMEEVKNRTGLLRVDSSVFSKIFTGKMPGKKVKAAICDILSLDADSFSDAEKS